ncbi:streptophobe family protein [Streptomyces globosus]|uniref:streptophobe family protein n=1 Tax=Streptomyces globosus TaxID=68209 RepID=UPI0038259D3F
MSRTSADSRGARPAWRDALVAAAAGFAVMAAVAAAGLACAGAARLPGAAFPHVVAAVVVLAAGGSVEVAGGEGLLRAEGSLALLPLSVSLAGALACGLLFLRPLRHRAVAGGGELLARAGPLVLLWLAALTGTALLARRDFTVSPGDPALEDASELLGPAPTVGFRADLPATVLFGLLWIAGLLLVVLLVSRRAPLPARLVRFHAAVRPAASATAVLLLAYVALGLGTGLVAAVTRGQPDRVFAVVLLALPNLAWLALTLGFGGAWDGRAEGPFGLPVPQVLDRVVRDADRSAVDVADLARHDGRMWWLVAVTALALLGTGLLAALRSPAHVRARQHALHLAVALGAAALAVSLLASVEARFGLALMGIGDTGGLGTTVELLPVLWRNVGLGVLWGAVAGFLGALAARPVHRRAAAGGGSAAPRR